MNKSKKVAVGVATAVCTLAVSAMALSACGATDWTKYKYDDFAKTSVEKWDAKEITYQLSDDNAIDLTKSNSTVILINLYADGSMAYLQGLIFKEYPTDWNWGIYDLHVRWINYGYWTELENGDIEMNYTHWWASDPKWTDDDGQEFDEESKDQWKKTTLTKSGSEWTLAAGDLTYWFMGAGNTGGNVESYDVTVKSDLKVKYNSFSAWHDSWKGNIPESSGGPAGAPPASDADKE